MEKIVRKAPGRLLESGQLRTIRQEFARIGLLLRNLECIEMFKTKGGRPRSLEYPSPWALIFSVP